MTSKAAPSLEPDCTHCAALCCVMLAFDRSPQFAFDKAAGEPCRNLAGDNSCRIHSELAGRGFTGCVLFDCLGAGQRVTQDVFGGKSWREDPALMLPMLHAFEGMRKVHEMLLLLREARKLPLNETQQEELAALDGELDPPGGWSPEMLARVEPLEMRVDEFLASLRTVARR